MALLVLFGLSTSCGGLGEVGLRFMRVVILS